MKCVILYKSIDPYYSDHTQVFVGTSQDEIERQIAELDDYLGRNHAGGIDFIYKKQIL